MKLFLSYAGLLYAIARNEVPQEDLDTGLFYFGCVRQHALTPGQAGEPDERVNLKERGAPAHEKLLAAVQKAESEGRCRWHRPELGRQLPPYATLSELLAAHGFNVTLPEDITTSIDDRYCYPRVRDALQEQGSALSVLF